MKKLLIILFAVFLASCQSAAQDDALLNSNEPKKVENEQKLQSSFPPNDSPIARILHSEGWEEAYDFYKNKLEMYKNESYYQVGKIFIMGKVLGNESFKHNPDSNALNTFLNDIFNDSLPSPAMVVRIIEIVDNHPNLNSINLRDILSKNKQKLIQMKKNVENIRKTEYNPQFESSNLSVPNFEEKVSKYVNLD